MLSELTFIQVYNVVVNLFCLPSQFFSLIQLQVGTWKIYVRPLSDTIFKLFEKLNEIKSS